MMQTDVKSVHTGGTQTNQSLVSGRVRLKAVMITGGAGAGAGKFLDASGGNVLLELDTGTNSNMTNVLLPGGATDTALLPGSGSDRRGADGQLLAPSLMRSPLRAAQRPRRCLGNLGLRLQWFQFV